MAPEGPGLLGLLGALLLLTSSSMFAGGHTLQFTDQTAAAGINARSNISTVDVILGGGVVGDFNLDGWQDVYYPTGTNGPDKLYINNGDGTFTDQAAAWGLTEVHFSSAAAVGDYNGDGLPDIFVTCYGPGPTPAMGEHHLYRNTGSSFVDEGASAGVNQCSTVEPAGFGGSWGDIDLDGDIDLMISGFSDPATGNCLMRNNGDGTFTDITESAGLLPSIEGLAGYTPHFVDMDDDRYPEIIWIGDFSTSLYYINNGDGTFTDYTAASNTSQDNSEMGMTVGDWNLDGLFDFYVSTIGTNNMYINLGNHQYDNQGDTAGVSMGGFGWGTISFDMDHDGRFDLVNVAQSGPNTVFRNSYIGGGASFIEIASEIGMGFQADGRGVVNLDYDNDGDQDVMIFRGGQPIILMRNDLSGDGINWLRVFLDRGTTRNIPSFGIGSKVSIEVDGKTLIDRIDGGSNYLSQSEMSAHFGLGDNTMVGTVRVEWSNGMVTELHNVAANQTITVLPPDLSYKSGFE